VKKENKSNNISDEELSLISVISGLDNKLEELDHNISLISKENNSLSKNTISGKKIDKKIKDLEDKIQLISKSISESQESSGSEKYLNTMPTKDIIGTKRKGYAVAENLRLKRIDTIEKSLNRLIKKFDLAFGSSFDINKTPESDNLEITSEEYLVSPEEFYIRSKRIFFGFLFSIIIIFLLIIVTTENYIFENYIFVKLSGIII
tara:strand:+ start:1365 stop:1979 length:615 start_codon:yes stop_codon:yes gene_type:complete